MKRLTRSRTNRKIAGVCAGLGHYLNVDPTAVRLIAVIILVFTGFVPMILAYLLAWVVIPEE